jgi:hypothetical protein
MDRNDRLGSAVDDKAHRGLVSAYALSLTSFGGDEVYLAKHALWAVTVP